MEQHDAPLRERLRRARTGTREGRAWNDLHTALAHSCRARTRKSKHFDANDKILKPHGDILCRILLYVSDVPYG